MRIYSFGDMQTYFTISKNLASIFHLNRYMINFGLKCTSWDFHEKKISNPDFFEIILSSVDLSADIIDIFHEIHEMHRRIYIHLPTSYEDLQRNRTLLNVASADLAVRKKSRFILEELIEKTKPYNISWYVVHSPTRYNFSIEKLLFTPAEDTDFIRDLAWFQQIDHRIMVENIPPAILFKNQTFWVLPFSAIQLREKGIPMVLDTGHLYSESWADEGYMRSIETLMDHISYAHIATLYENLPHDSHGRIFNANRKEFPSLSLIEETIKKLILSANKSWRNLFLVCEPGGNTDLHLDTLKIMREKYQITLQTSNPQ